MYSCKGIYFAAVFPTLLLIPGTPGTVFNTTATPTGIENIGVYLAIAVFICINIVYKQVTEIVKDIWAIDCQLNRFKDFLSEIKNKLAFIKCGITVLVYNARLLDIEFK